MTPIDREKILSLGVVKGYTAEMNRKERILAKDRDAYRRLRTEGLQPPRVDGSAQLERDAVSSLEIQTGVVQANLPAKERVQMAQRLAEMEFTPR